MMPAYKRKLRKGERWYYSGQYVGYRYHSKCIYLTKREALKAERKHLAKLDKKVRNPQYMTLKELTEKRLEHLSSKSKDYYKENKRYFDKALEVWGDCDINLITKAMVNELLKSEADRLKDSGKSNHKVNAMLRCLKALFNFGIKVYDLDHNPCRLDMYPIDKKLKYIPTDDEVEAVRQDLNGTQRLMFDICDQTAARINEVVRLTYEDIDDDLMTLWTRKAKNSDLTPRRVPTPDCLKGLKGKGKVFPHTGYPRFLEGNGWNFHNLRHRRASIWVNSGMSIYEIMSRLGHSNMSTTMAYLQLLGFSRLKFG